MHPMNTNSKTKVVAFTGPSNSGKTTLIINLSQLLQNQGYKVSIIKHDPGNKAIFDREGKDSYKFFQTGADVAVVSPQRTTIFKQTTSQIETIIKSFDHSDFVLVEGLKTLPLPRICIQRNQLTSEYFELSDTIATDGTIDLEQFPSHMNILDLNNLEQIIQWIKVNAKVM